MKSCFFTTPQPHSLPSLPQRSPTSSVRPPPTPPLPPSSTGNPIREPTNPHPLPLRQAAVFVGSPSLPTISPSPPMSSVQPPAHHLCLCLPLLHFAAGQIRSLSVPLVGSPTTAHEICPATHSLHLPPPGTHSRPTDRSLSVRYLRMGDGDGDANTRTGILSGTAFLVSRKTQHRCQMLKYTWIARTRYHVVSICSSLKAEGSTPVICSVLTSVLQTCTLSTTTLQESISC